MNATKAEAIKMIGALPDNCSWDDIIYKIYVRKKIDIGLKAASKGKVISHAAVKKRFAK